MIVVKKFLAVRIEPQGSHMYVESKAGPGDWGYTASAKQALAMSESDALAFCQDQARVGKQTRLVQVLA